LTVRVGEEKPLVLEIERDHLDGPVELSFTAPPGVTVRASDFPAGADRVEVPISVGADVDPGEKTVTVVARADSLQREAVVSLRVKPAVFLPAGFKPVGDQVETDLTGREYFERIVLERPDCPAVTFVLVPRKEGDPDNMATFYVMENKVWNDLFDHFRKGNPRPTQWKAGKGDEWLPALNVTAAEAADLARWLGGRLPTTEQWDKAAGFFRQEGRAGPAKGPSVAVRRYGEGPRPVNCSPNDDVSPYGVRDLAGNGYEWTRNLAGEPGKTVPLEGEPEGPRRHLVILRGKSYRAPAPLTYADLEYQRKQGQALVQYYDAASPVTGFRVVIEPASQGR
jgi:hypothetical protein